MEFFEYIPNFYKERSFFQSKRKFKDYKNEQKTNMKYNNDNEKNQYNMNSNCTNEKSNEIFKILFTYDYLKEIYLTNKTSYLNILSKTENFYKNFDHLQNYIIGKRRRNYENHKKQRNTFKVNQLRFLQEFSKLRSKIDKNSIIYDKVQDILNYQKRTSDQIQILLYHLNKDEIIDSTKNERKSTNKIFKNTNQHFINYSNEERNSPKFPFQKISSIINQDNEINRTSKSNFKENNIFATEKFTFNLNDTDNFNNIQSGLASQHNFMNKINVEEERHKTYKYGYIDTEECNDYPLDKENFEVDKLGSQKITNIYNNSNIYDYFSFRVKNNNNNTINTMRSMNKNNLESLLSQSDKNENSKKFSKINETFSNYNFKNDISNHEFSDTFDMGLRNTNNQKKSNSPNRLYSNKFFDDTDTFRFNTEFNKLNLSQININSKNSSNSNMKTTNNINGAINQNYMAFSCNGTNKLFELTSNPFNLKFENSSLKNNEKQNVNLNLNVPCEDVLNMQISNMGRNNTSNNLNSKNKTLRRFKLSGFEDFDKNYNNDNNNNNEKKVVNNEGDGDKLKIEDLNSNNKNESGSENKKEKKINFQKIKFNNFLNLNKKNSFNTSISKEDNNKKNTGLNYDNLNNPQQISELNYIKKNLERNKEKSNNFIDNEITGDFLQSANFDKNENILNENNLNLDNSLIQGTNTDLIISSRKLEDKSLISGSDVIYDNYSQNSGKYLLDSKDKFKKVRGFNFKNNINTRKFNKPLISSNQLNNLTQENNIKQNMTIDESINNTIKEKKNFNHDNNPKNLKSNRIKTSCEKNEEKEKHVNSSKNMIFYDIDSQNCD